MPKTMPSVVDLAAALKDQGRLRIDIDRGSHLVAGGVVMEAMWRADVYEMRAGQRPKFLGTFVTDSEKGPEDESPADLLRQLAGIYDAGPLTVKG